ncbi:MAG: diguanylate cyclase [Candidatus Binatia bacterium]
MLQPKTLKIIALAVIYFLAAELALKLVFLDGGPSLLKPETGIALAAILILGYGIWPGIFLGALIANLAAGGSIAPAIGIAVGKCLEALISAALIIRFANGRTVFDRPQDISRFVLFATLVASMSAAVSMLIVGTVGFIDLEEFGQIWFTWWLDDIMGCLLVTPLLVQWSNNPGIGWNRGQVIERALFLLSFMVACLVVFGDLIPFMSGNYPLELLCVPFFIWTAVRFNQRETAAAIVVSCGIAIWGTRNGFGPFAMQTPQESFFLLQLFMGVTALMGMALSAIVSGHVREKTQLQHLAVTDPLTGIANYRKFIEVLNGELQRSQRSERHFAILFLDVDELKLLNDRQGHMIGNQALRKVAKVIRGSCRTIDTVARFGGDEFALVLPEADERAALRVADRIGKQLAACTDGPHVSVSVGVAEYPRDGESFDSLLSAADGVLYQAKRRIHKKTSEPRVKRNFLLRRLEAAFIGTFHQPSNTVEQSRKDPSSSKRVDL